MSKSINSIRGAVSFLLLVVFVSIGGSPASALPYDSGTRTGEVSCTTGTLSVLNGVITDNTNCAGTAAIPDGVTSIGIDAFGGTTSLASITIPSSVTRIEDRAFLGATALTSITIPNSVTYIGIGAFAYATSLSAVTLGNSLTIIEYGAFLGATALTSINIPNSVTSIGSQAFFGATSLTSITIPNSVTTIGDEAFSGATSLSSITIPNSVNIFGLDVFTNTPALTQYTYCGTALTEGQLNTAGLNGKTKLCAPVFVPPMLPSFAPSISLNNGTITCTIGEYSRAANSVAFSLFVDGNHVATNFSSTGDYLPSWLAPWATASTIQRSATLQSASWDIGVAGDASRASCWTLAYSNNATGLISSDQISLR